LAAFIGYLLATAAAAIRSLNKRYHIDSRLAKAGSPDEPAGDGAPLRRGWIQDAAERVPRRRSTDFRISLTAMIDSAAPAHSNH
jgi:hypothetical protein